MKKTRTTSHAASDSEVTARTASGSGRASLAVSAGIFLSRVLGLVRDQVFAHYLGNSPAAGAFRAALRIPNFLQNLFGEGVLSASFIPVYSRLRAEGKDDSARVVAGAVGSILAILISGLVLIGVLATPWFVDLVAPGFNDELKDLTIQIVRILFPGVGLLVLSAWCLGVLNSHRQFFLSYAAPVFWNLALIATLFGFGPNSTQEDLVISLAWGSVVGSFLQFAVQLPSVFRLAGRLRFGLGTDSQDVRETFKNLGPVLLSRGVVQISAYIDGMIASYLGSAAVASLAYAQTLYLLPISLFGMAVAAAELPELSTSAGTDEAAHARLRKRLLAGRRRIAFFVVPSVVAFTILGRQVVEVLFQTGKFTPEDTRYVWYILIGSVIGLIAATWGRLYSSAFYALRDTRTPFKFAILRVILTIGLGLLFAFPLRGEITRLLTLIPGMRLPTLSDIEVGMGAVGLTASAGIAGWVEFMLLKNALENRIGREPLSGLFMAKVWAAALTAAAIALEIDFLMRPFLLEYTLKTLPFIRINWLGLIAIATYGTLYLALALFLNLEEPQAVWNRVSGFLGRHKRK